MSSTRFLSSGEHIEHKLNENRTWARTGRDGCFQSVRTSGRDQNGAKAYLVSACDNLAAVYGLWLQGITLSVLGQAERRVDAIHERIAERAGASAIKILKTMANLRKVTWSFLPGTATRLAWARSKGRTTGSKPWSGKYLAIVTWNSLGWKPNQLLRLSTFLDERCL